MMDLAKLLQIPQVDNTLPFDISPDGKSIVFSWNKSGKWELWQMLPEKGAGLFPTKLPIELGGSKFAPRFSPNGRQLAFALDLDGSESFHIGLFDLDNGTAKDLTPDIAYAYQPNFSWSMDGKTLAVLSDMKGQFAAYLLPLDGEPQRLLKNIFRPCWDAAWSPDGQRVAIEAEYSASDRSIFLVPTNRPRKGPKPYTIQVKVNEQPVNAQHPAWSPDSTTLAFSAEHGEWHKIGLLNLQNLQVTWLTEGTGDDTQPAWSQDGKSIGWIHSQGAATWFQIKHSNGLIQQSKVGDGVHSFPRFTPDGIVMLYEDPQHPCDLWRLDLEKNSFTQLTDSRPPEVISTPLLQPEEVWFPGMDGVQVPAMLYRAQNSTCAVIQIHGGPNWHLQYMWQPLISHMVSRGWTVLAPNYRGSTGYGRQWQMASRYDMGGVDTDDCAAGVDFLIQNGLALPDRIAVTGRSHGGYLTMTCLTKYPDRFAAGAAVVPFLNWFKSHTRSREDLQHWNIENMGDPEDHRNLWHERSPYFFLDRIKAPVQLICGAHDPRCPASESIDAHDKLVELGKEVELLLYQDEGHTFLKIENVVDAELKLVNFLAKALNQAV